MILLIYALDVSLTFEPPSYEWIFVCGMNYIYRHILNWDWVETLGFFLQPEENNQQKTDFSPNSMRLRMVIKNESFCSLCHGSGAQRECVRHTTLYVGAKKVVFHYFLLFSFIDLFFHVNKVPKLHELSSLPNYTIYQWKTQNTFELSGLRKNLNYNDWWPD